MRMRISEYWCGREIYGELFLPPTGDGPFPTVVICEGFGGSYRDNQLYASYFARMGVAGYIFDFKGGSRYSRSGGNTLDMTICTEIRDLGVVFKALQKDARIDPTKIFLMGESQGGLVAALYAAKRPNDVKGLILFYPGFAIPELIVQDFQYDFPRRHKLWDMEISDKYYSCIASIDVYNEIGKYRGPVLILHGNQDVVVPIHYSKRAVAVYNRATLVVVRGQGHGFYKDERSSFILRLLAKFVNKEIKGAAPVTKEGV